ncbi:MAG: hypothetical protein AB1486_25960 [Planctomycetota bacterium]
MALLNGASNEDLEEARDALALITSRGFDRGKNLIQDLDGFLRAIQLTRP